MKDSAEYYLPRHCDEVEDGIGPVQVIKGTEVDARSLKTSSERLYAGYLKRGTDIVFTLAALPIILPVLIGLYFIVRRDGGPFLYSHQRIGKDGATFGCLKIRTMVVDAEKVLMDLIERNADVRDEWRRHFKLRNDPRITPIGRVLRKTSLDELPQIFNILFGHMSVVGPRPITDEELKLYGQAAAAYKAVRPGLTGPWQITGRRDNDFNQRAVLDVEYVRGMGFWRDLYIIFATVPEVLFARGR